MQQLREALKILAERVLILEHMIGVHGEHPRGSPELSSGLCTPHYRTGLPQIGVRALCKITGPSPAWLQARTRAGPTHRAPLGEGGPS